MFEFIGNLLQNIAQFFTSVWDFILNIVNEIVFVVQSLAKVVTTIPQYFGWLPAGVLGTLLVIIGVVVVYKIMGRE